MKSILVLTDFSDTSLHATLYAAALAHQFRTERFILYHAFGMIVPISEAAMSLTDNGESLHKESLNSLKLFHTKIEGAIPPGTTIESKAGDIDLSVFINEIAAQEEADMIVMGITGKTKLGQLLMGSNAIRIADESRFPVLIVPNEAAIGKVNRIVLIFDREKLPEIIPLAILKKILDDFHAEVVVAKVDHNEVNPSLQNAEKGSELLGLLRMYDPSYYNIDNSGGESGIVEFANQHEGSLIIMISKNQGFFEGLFHPNVTHKLAWKSHVPLLVIPGK